MAHSLRGYDYEPEYTAEEVKAWSKAAVRPMINLVVVPQFSRDLARCVLETAALRSANNHSHNFYHHTSSLFQLNCHFHHAKYMTLLNINLYFKPHIFKGW